MDNIINESDKLNALSDIGSQLARIASVLEKIDAESILDDRTEQND